jgi:hypothetical protein
MSGSSLDRGDLLDLKLMPAWVKEPSTGEDYAAYEGEETPERNRRHEPARGRERGREMRRTSRPDNRDKQGRRERHPGRGRPQGRRPEQPPPQPEQPLDVGVRFLPRSAVLENVVAQVKTEPLAYSLFFLARSFLDKPQRYEVELKTKPENPLYQLGDAGPVSTDRGFLETNAFRLAQGQFYRTEETQTEPVKGNFTSVARCRASGVVLGPTNHHDYQRKLRGHYEQRFSRRMSFAEYQRQIEIVTDPAAVEQWKEEARRQTSFVTLDEQAPLTFQNGGEAERHFREHHLAGLIRTVESVVIDGVASRQSADRRLRHHIEQAWSAENQSPSHMMQELAKGFREAGLHIFRHRRGMLFVSSIRVRPLIYDEQSVSPQVKAILELVGGSPRIRRKQVADKLLVDAGDALETKRLALASDLRWLISEGYLIEFNDGALDLPRVKAKKPEEKRDAVDEIAPAEVELASAEAAPITQPDSITTDAQIASEKPEAETHEEQEKDAAVPTAPK